MPLEADSVDITFQHMHGSLYFFNKKFLNFDILSLFLYKIYSRLCLLGYNSVMTTPITECQHTITYLPFFNLGAKS